MQIMLIILSKLTIIFQHYTFCPEETFFLSSIDIYFLGFPLSKHCFIYYFPLFPIKMYTSRLLSLYPFSIIIFFYSLAKRKKKTTTKSNNQSRVCVCVLY